MINCLSLSRQHRQFKALKNGKEIAQNIDS
jgi:hypothetical protein